jgi:hypothetical protein
MKSYITSAISGNTAAQPDGNTMYIIYLPPGIDDIDDSGRGTNTNCSLGYGGYHQPYGSGGDAWGFSRVCPIAGTGLSELQTRTVAASHEIIESATDPHPGNGYTFGQQNFNGNVWQALAGGGEVGDLCNQETIFEGGYTYTRVWSNSAAQSKADPCAPAITGYFNAAPSQPTANGWYAMSGTTLSIPITGFSTDPVSNWYLAAQPVEGQTTKFSATVTSATKLGTAPALNNGLTATLNVTATGGSGSYTVLYLASESTSGNPVHLFPIGVYVQ